MDFVATLPAPLTEASRRFFAEWHRWRGAGLVPQRSAMDAGRARLGELLTRCLLLEVRGPDDMPIHFAGTTVGALLGAELGGRNYLDLTLPTNRRQRAQLLLAEVTQPCAAVIYYWLETETGLLPVEVVSAPLFDGAKETPTLVLACATPLTRGDNEEQVAPRSYAEGEGLHFIDIGAGVPALQPGLCADRAVES